MVHGHLHAQHQCRREGRHLEKGLLARDEGEGDRTRRDWLAAHVRYFSSRSVAEGFVFDESMPAVFERFTLVWPPEEADAEGSGS